MGRKHFTELGYSTISIYASLLKDVREVFEQYPSFRELWALDIANEFIKQYQEDEFVKVYANNDDEIREMAFKAANNFLDKITKANLDPFIKFEDDYQPFIEQTEIKK
jgi:6-phosphogluconate dehydrogenase